MKDNGDGGRSELRKAVVVTPVAAQLFGRRVDMVSDALKRQSSTGQLSSDELDAAHRLFANHTTRLKALFRQAEQLLSGNFGACSTWRQLVLTHSSVSAPWPPPQNERELRAWTGQLLESLAGVLTLDAVAVFVGAAERSALILGGDVERSVTRTLQLLSELAHPLAQVLRWTEVRRDDGAGLALLLQALVKPMRIGPQPIPIPAPPLPTGPDDNPHGFLIPRIPKERLLGFIKKLTCALTRPQAIAAYLNQVQPKATDITSLNPSVLCPHKPGTLRLNGNAFSDSNGQRPADVALGWAYWSPLFELAGSPGFHLVPDGEIVEWQAQHIAFNQPPALTHGGHFGFVYSGLYDYVQRNPAQFPLAHKFACFAEDELLWVPNQDTARFELAPKPTINLFKFVERDGDQLLTPEPNNVVDVEGCQTCYRLEWDVTLLPDLWQGFILPGGDNNYASNVVPMIVPAGDYDLHLDVRKDGVPDSPIALFDPKGHRDFAPISGAKSVEYTLVAKNVCGTANKLKTLNVLQFLHLDPVAPQAELREQHLHLFINQPQQVTISLSCPPATETPVTLRLEPVSGAPLPGITVSSQVVLSPQAPEATISLVYDGKLGDGELANLIATVEGQPAIQAFTLPLKTFITAFELVPPASVEVAAGFSKTADIPVERGNGFVGKISARDAERISGSTDIKLSWNNKSAQLDDGQQTSSLQVLIDATQASGGAVGKFLVRAQSGDNGPSSEKALTVKATAPASVKLNKILTQGCIIPGSTLVLESPQLPALAGKPFYISLSGIAPDFSWSPPIVGPGVKPDGVVSADGKLTYPFPSESAIDFSPYRRKIAFQPVVADIAWGAPVVLGTGSKTGDFVDQTSVFQQMPDLYQEPPVRAEKDEKIWYYPDQDNPQYTLKIARSGGPTSYTTTIYEGALGGKVLVSQALTAIIGQGEASIGGAGIVGLRIAVVSSTTPYGTAPNSLSFYDLWRPGSNKLVLRYGFHLNAKGGDVVYPRLWLSPDSTIAGILTAYPNQVGVPAQLELRDLLTTQQIDFATGLFSKNEIALQVITTGCKVHRRVLQVGPGTISEKEILIPHVLPS